MKDYVLHLRPKSFVPSFLFTLSGYALVSPKPSTLPGLAQELAVLFLIYSVFLWGGTNAINSAFDDDKGGPIGFLPNPPPPPRHLCAFGCAWMLAGTALAFFFSPTAALLCLLCLALSLFYSVPLGGRQGKHRPLVDISINALGCGILAVLLPITLAGQTPNKEVWLTGIAFTLTFAGTFAATQLYQMKPQDTYATARNYTALLGPATALKLSSVFYAAGIVLLALARRPESIFFSSFAVVLSAAALFLWAWSRAPFHQAKFRRNRVYQLVLIARVFWILSAWTIF